MNVNGQLSSNAYLEKANPAGYEIKIESMTDDDIFIENYGKNSDPTTHSYVKSEIKYEQEYDSTEYLEHIKFAIKTNDESIYEGEQKKREDELSLHQPEIACQSAPEESLLELVNKDGICSSELKVEEPAVQHIPSDKITVYCCKRCNYITTRKPYFKSHLLIHKQNSKHNRYMEKNRLKWRRPVCSDKPKFVVYLCELCEFKTTNKTTLKGHMRTHSVKKCRASSKGVTYRCKICPFKAGGKPRFDDHMLLHEDSSVATIYRRMISEFNRKYNRSLHLD